MFFSLVCVTYGRYNELGRLLKSLQEQSYKDLELIVIDQNKDGKIDNLLSSFHHDIGIKHIKVDYNNLSRSRNQGAIASKGKWMLFPDDDCWYHKDFFKMLSMHLDKNVELPIFFTNWTDPTQQPHRIMFPFSEGVMSVKEVFENASSICIVLRKDIFFLNNGFNEKMGLGDGTVVKAGEDQELLLRLQSKGFDVFKVLELSVYHLIDSRVWNKSFEQRIIGSGATDYYLLSKYFGLKKALMTFSWWVAGCMYNLLRLRKKNFKWFFLKIKGAIFLSRNLSRDSSLVDEQL